MKATAPRSCFPLCVSLVCCLSPLSGQEITRSTGRDMMAGLEVEDPHRLGITLVLGPGWDRDATKEAFERELVRAGIEWTDLEDPREGEVLYVYGGHLESAVEDSTWRTFTIEELRLELWRPVRYAGTGGTEYLAPGMTFRIIGSTGGGYRPDQDIRGIACRQAILSLRTFLSEFLKANGTSYEPPDDEPRGCASSQ